MKNKPRQTSKKRSPKNNTEAHQKCTYYKDKNQCPFHPLYLTSVTLKNWGTLGVPRVLYWLLLESSLSSCMVFWVFFWLGFYRCLVSLFVSLVFYFFSLVNLFFLGLHSQNTKIWVWKSTLGFLKRKIYK